MNYLAHFHLAGDTPGLLVGGLLGDYVKGPLTGKWAADIEQGIWLHRRIDGFSTHHPMAQTIGQRLPARFRRYAGILQDMVCDYFLSLHWQQYSTTPLEAFAQGVYQVLEQHSELLPAPARQFSERLAEYDLLCRYRHWETIDRSLASIGARLHGTNPLQQAAGELQNHLTELGSVFSASYPDIIAFSALQRRLLTGITS